MLPLDALSDGAYLPAKMAPLIELEQHGYACELPLRPMYLESSVVLLVPDFYMKVLQNQASSEVEHGENVLLPGLAVPGEVAVLVVLLEFELGVCPAHGAVVARVRADLVQLPSGRSHRQAVAAKAEVVAGGVREVWEGGEGE